MHKGLQTDFAVRDDGVLVMSNRLCVLDIKELKKEDHERNSLLSLCDASW